MTYKVSDPDKQVQDALFLFIQQHQPSINELILYFGKKFDEVPEHIWTYETIQCVENIELNFCLLRPPLKLEKDTQLIYFQNYAIELVSSGFFSQKYVFLPVVIKKENYLFMIAKDRLSLWMLSNA